MITVSVGEDSCSPYIISCTANEILYAYACGVIVCMISKN